MIPRINRFRSSRAIENVYKKGLPVREEALSAKISASKKEGTRLTVVVSKKVSKSAVVRNRIRRRIYEQFRRLEFAEYLGGGYDIVITVFDNKTASMPAGDLSQICQKLLQKMDKRIK